MERFCKWVAFMFITIGFITGMAISTQAANGDTAVNEKLGVPIVVYQLAENTRDFSRADESTSVEA